MENKTIPSVSVIDDAELRARAQKSLTRTLRNYILVRIGVLAVGAGINYLISKKFAKMALNQLPAPDEISKPPSGVYVFIEKNWPWRF